MNYNPYKRNINHEFHSRKRILPHTKGLYEGWTPCIEFTWMSAPTDPCAKTRMRAFSAVFEIRQAGYPPAIFVKDPIPLETLTMRP
jgi:hypothetical protein